MRVEQICDSVVYSASRTNIYLKSVANVELKLVEFRLQRGLTLELNCRYLISVLFRIKLC